MRARRSLVLCGGLLSAASACGTLLGDDDARPDTPTDAGADASADASAEGSTTGADATVGADGETTPCIDRPMAWAPGEPFTSAVATRVRAPFMLPGALTFVAEETLGVLRLVRGQRGAVTEPFAVAMVGNEAFALEPSPTSAFATEVIYTDDTQQLRVAREAGGWASVLPEGFAAPVAGETSQWPSLSGDGRLLVFHHTLGSVPALVQRTRDGLGLPFGGSRDLALPPDILPLAFSHPALTSDGLGLFYVSNNATYFVQRASTEDPFFTPILPQGQEVTTLAPGTRVRSMSADGCTLYLSDVTGALTSKRL